MIKAVDLFCGAGGLTRGLLNVGIQVELGVDIDKSCEFAYVNNNFKINGENVRFLEKSVSELNNEVVEVFNDTKHSVLVGCAPCQPFSNHQKNKSERKNHNKWGLLYDFANEIKKSIPSVVSMENVPSLIHEEVFTDFLLTLKELNYNVFFDVVNAADYGVPQRRRRLILLASRLGAISLIPPTHKNNHRYIKEVIGHLPTLEAGEQNQNDPLHKSAGLSKLNLERIKSSKPGGSWKDWDECLLPECYKRESGKSYSSVYGRMKWDALAPTLTTQFDVYGTGRFGHPEQNRALSLREGALLQTFPENYLFFEGNTYVKNDVARAIGNAVPVRLGEVIGESILNHFKDFLV